MAQWFRKYADILESVKIQSLSDKLYRRWDSLLALACRYEGKLPADEQIAFALRIKLADVKPLLKIMIDRRLFDVQEDGEIIPHNWNKRQYKGDCSTDRVKRFRERQGKRDETVSVTPPEAETETDSETKQSRAAKAQRLVSAFASKATGKQKSSLPPNERKAVWQSRVCAEAMRTMPDADYKRWLGAFGEDEKWAKDIADKISLVLNARKAQRAA